MYRSDGCEEMEGSRLYALVYIPLTLPVSAYSIVLNARWVSGDTVFGHRSFRYPD
jgi:hypothetical protein